LETILNTLISHVSAVMKLEITMLVNVIGVTWLLDSPMALLQLMEAISLENILSKVYIYI